MKYAFLPQHLTSAPYYDFGSALRLVASQRVNVPYNQALTDTIKAGASIVFWVNLQKQPTLVDHVILEQFVSSVKYWRIYLRPLANSNIGRGIFFACRDDSKSYNFAATIAAGEVLNTFDMLAFNINFTTLRVTAFCGTRNVSLTSTIDFPAAFTLDDFTGVDYCIGRSTVATPIYRDTMSVYNNVLTKAQYETLFNNRRGNDPNSIAGLTNYWDFDGNSNTAYLGSTGNLNILDSVGTAHGYSSGYTNGTTDFVNHDTLS